MTQSELDQAVVQRTGESRATIRDHGFSLLSPLNDMEDLSETYLLDCPGCGATVLLTDEGLASLPELAECNRCDAAFPYEYAEIYSRDERNAAIAICA